MAEEEVGVLCYWNCPIKHGPDGVYFEVSTPPKMMRVKKKTDFSRFLDELYLITGLDKQKSKLELLYRRPLCQWPHKFSHLLYPVENDASFETMLEIPSSHPSVDNVQLYLEVIPTSCDAVAACSLSHLENPRRSSKRRKRTEQEVGDTNSDASFNNAGLCLVSDLWLDNDAMRVGLCFKDIGELKKAVHWWSIKREQKCLVRETGKDMYVFECVRWQCKWSICAAIMEKDGLFEVTKCSGPHTCRRGYSPHFELVFLADEIERVFRVHPTLSTAELVKWWEEKFEYPLEAVAEHHGKGLVQDAKVKAIKRLFGDWDQSFKLLPKLMSAIHSSNGLLVDWQYGSLPNPEYASFRGVFWAFPQSVQGFQHCRPVIVVGSKNLGGKYDMNLMIASAFDAAEQFFPLAFAVTEEVCINSWRWFLTRIREKVTQRQGLCLISILDPDIVDVINEPWSQWKEPLAYHRFCLDHLSSQFCSVSPGYEDVQFLVKQAGLSSQKEEFDSYMKKIKEKNPEAWKSLNQIPPQQWALPYDSGRRFGIIKIDSEALFAVCKRFGKVAMAGGVMLLFGELRDAFDESFSRSRGSLSRGDVYIEPVMEKLEELTKGSFTCVVTPLERDAFQVTTKDRMLFRLGLSGHTTCRIVQLNDSTCTCGKFQLKKFPCLHALAVCDKLKINPLQYVDDCYTVERYHNTYAATFSPVPKLSAWPEASGVPTLLPPVIGLLHIEEDEEEDDDDDDDDGGDDDDDDGDDDDDDEDE